MDEVVRPARLLSYAVLVPMAALAALLCAYLAGVGMGPLDEFMARWAGLVLEIGGALACAARAFLVRRERRAWALIAVAVGLWVAGDTIWRALYYGESEPPLASVADLLWLGFYPTAYAGIVLLIRERARHVDATVLMDGLIAALAVAALAAAVLLPAVSGSDATTANFVYVLCDSVLVSLVLVAFAVVGWRLDEAWAWLGAALALFAICDSVYVYEVAHGTYQGGGLLDFGWSLALLTIGLAAWRTAPARHTSLGEAWRPIAFPIGFGFAALAIEVYDHFVNVTVLSLALASACLVGVLARLAATFADNQRMLHASHLEARTDSLTGLGNRRQLMADLRSVFASQPPRRTVLLIYDLDGFKDFNDRFGHEAGDALLARRGGALAQALGSLGAAYRLGGDEFCVLADGAFAAPGELEGLAGRALAEIGPGYRVSCSSGRALVPDEAEDLSGALRLADQRMYAQKGRRREGDRRLHYRSQPSDRRQQAAAAESDPGRPYSPIALITRRFGRRPSNSQ